MDLKLYLVISKKEGHSDMAPENFTYSPPRKQVIVTWPLETLSTHLQECKSWWHGLETTKWAGHGDMVCKFTYSSSRKYDMVKWLRNFPYAPPRKKIMVTWPGNFTNSLQRKVMVTWPGNFTYSPPRK